MKLKIKSLNFIWNYFLQNDPKGTKLRITSQYIKVSEFFHGYKVIQKSCQ